MTGQKLAGRRAFVLGASSEGGIGEAIARRFKEDGAKVMIGGRSAEGLRGVADRLGVEHVVCDIGAEGELADALAAAAAAMGGLDIAVNAAGQNRSKPIAEESFAGLAQQAAVHFVGTTLFIRYAAEQMADGGSIIILSSVTAELTNPGLAAYAGSKAAADKVVRVAALEYGQRGIRVNSLAPGLTRTPMTTGHFANDKLVDAFLRETPTGRLGEPEHVAAAAAWLADSECTTTGDLIRVSGGIHLRRLPTARDIQG